MTKTDNSRFRGGLAGSTYICRVCSKRTRETGEGESSLDLCKACYIAAGWLAQGRRGRPESGAPSCAKCATTPGHYRPEDCEG